MEIVLNININYLIVTYFKISARHTLLSNLLVDCTRPAAFIARLNYAHPVQILYV